MKKLLNLKNWLTLEETARHLSLVFDEEVTEADVLRLGLDGRLQLSVNFVNNTIARYGKVVGIEEVVQAEFPAVPMTAELPLFRVAGRPSGNMSRLNIDGEPFLILGDEVKPLYRVWDLAMVAGERFDIERMYQQLSGGPEVTLSHNSGIFVQSRDGQAMFQLQETDEENEFVTYPAGRLPEDAVIVVRITSLREFEWEFGGVPSAQEKPLTTTERNSMLTVIAALCDYSAIDVKGRGAAGQIARLTQGIGAAVSDDTVRRFLDKIPEALEARAK